MHIILIKLKKQHKNAELVFKYTSLIPPHVYLRRLNCVVHILSHISYAIGAINRDRFQPLLSTCRRRVQVFFWVGKGLVVLERGLGEDV